MHMIQRDFPSLPQAERPIKIKGIQWIVSQRIVCIEPWTIRFTPTEYRLLFPLRHGSPMTYAQLATDAYGCSIDARVREVIDKHIDHIRVKLEGSGLYVYCVLGYGYVLLPTEEWTNMGIKEKPLEHQSYAECRIPL